MDLYNKVIKSRDYINKIIDNKASIGIILGSGLRKLVDVLEDKIYIKYEDIPNFPVSTVKGHSGNLVYGRIDNKYVLCMEGRFHYYEGYSMKEVTYPLYVFKMLGINNIIVTNACGGINRSFSPGTLMIIDDFINLMGDNPLIGINDERFGPRFPDMSEPYSYDLIQKAKSIAERKNISYKEGVYAGFMGPYYETRSEIVMIERHGADAVGMSTVPETIVANYLGMKVLGISVITNMATGIQKVKHSHQRVIEIANMASDTLSDWIVDFIIEL